METAEKLGDDVGLHQACRALGVSRASFYRRRRRKESPTTERPATPSPRALNALERGHVREVLNSERFMGRSPISIAIMNWVFLEENLLGSPETEACARAVVE